MREFVVMLDNMDTGMTLDGLRNWPQRCFDSLDEAVEFAKRCGFISRVINRDDDVVAQVSPINGVTWA